MFLEKTIRRVTKKGSEGKGKGEEGGRNKQTNFVLSISVTASLNWCTSPRDMPNMCQKCVTLQKSMLWNGQGWWVNSMTSPSFLPPLSCWCLPLINFNQKRESKKTPLIQTLEIGLMKHWPDQSRQTWRKRINSRKASQLYNQVFWAWWATVHGIT